MIMKHSHPERKRGISHDYYETLHPHPTYGLDLQEFSELILSPLTKGWVGGSG